MTLNHWVEYFIFSVGLVSVLLIFGMGLWSMISLAIKFSETRGD